MCLKAIQPAVGLLESPRHVVGRTLRGLGYVNSPRRAVRLLMPVVARFRQILANAGSLTKAPIEPLVHVLPSQQACSPLSSQEGESYEQDSCYLCRTGCCCRP